MRRSAKIDAFWEKARVDPVEIALPSGVGYTLRAYRMSDTVEEDEPEDATPADLDDSDREPADGEPADEDDSAGRAKESAASSSRRKRIDEDSDDEDLDEEDLDESDEDLDEDEEEDEEPEPEEVPVFLTWDRPTESNPAVTRRALLLFRTPDGLAEFVRSDEASHLDVIEDWDTVRAEITADHVVPSDEDQYELDLVVKNLREGHDVWDSELLIKAGEVCRDLGHALRLDSVMNALSTGSPLDELDEVLRNIESGRIGAFFARRRLRRIGSQQAALAWRSIIGKISTSVDWRD
ncbi:MAG: DNA primase [Micromonosporaceae bacterium]|nr:DNA primase [Micromonosporaceae bacterium]